MNRKSNIKWHRKVAVHGDSRRETIDFYWRTCETNRGNFPRRLRIDISIILVEFLPRWRRCKVLWEFQKKTEKKRDLKPREGYVEKRREYACFVKMSSAPHDRLHEKTFVVIGIGCLKPPYRYSRYGTSTLLPVYFSGNACGWKKVFNQRESEKRDHEVGEAVCGRVLRQRYQAIDLQSYYEHWKI